MLGIGASTHARLAFAQLSDTAALNIPIEEIIWVLTPRLTDLRQLRRGLKVRLDYDLRLDLKVRVGRTIRIERA